MGSQRQQTEEEKGGGLQLDSSGGVGLSLCLTQATEGEAQIFQGYLFVGYIFPEQGPNPFVFAESTIVSKEKKKQTSWSKGFP